MRDIEAGLSIVISRRDSNSQLHRKKGGFPPLSHSFLVPPNRPPHFKHISLLSQHFMPTSSLDVPTFMLVEH